MNLECCMCNDLVDVEARTVVLPFTCKWCQEGFTPVPTDTQFDLDTKMIEDLETQLRDARDIADGQVDYWRDAYRDLDMVRKGLEADLCVEQAKTWWDRLWD